MTYLVWYLFISGLIAHLYIFFIFSKKAINDFKNKDL